MKFARTSILIILTLPILFISENISGEPDTRGTEFYFNFMPNYHQAEVGIAPYDSLYVYVTGSEAASGRIEFFGDYGEIGSVPFVLPPAGGTFSLAKAWRNLELHGWQDEYSGFLRGDTGEKKRKFFRVIADEEVSVYALSKSYKSTDGTVIFPTDVLGTDYFVMSYFSNEANNYDMYGYPMNLQTPSQFSILAVENNTRVQISLSDMAFGRYSKDFSLMLDAGESYLVQADTSSQGLYRDLTGSRISSDKPVAVFAGHRRALLPNNYSGTLVSRDHLFSQMPPIDSWGKTCVITPLPEPDNTLNFAYDIFRILAAEDNTEIYFNDEFITRLDAGDYYEEPLTRAIVVRSDKKILAAQYKKSSSVAGTNFSYEGDPYFLIVPPNKQFLTEYTAFNLQVTQRYPLEAPHLVYDEQFLVLTAPTQFISTIRIDGFPVDESTFRAIGNTCYSYAFIPVSSGRHGLTGEKPFGVYVCGYGNADSYGYLGGMSFSKTEEKNPEVSLDVFICPGDTAYISCENCETVSREPREGLDNPDAMTTAAFPDSTTTYTCVMTDEYGCVFTDEVIVAVFDPPVADAGPDMKICKGESTVLNASGGRTYSWQPHPTLSGTNTQNPTVSPEEETVYILTVFDRHGCSDTDSVKVSFYSDPVADAGPDTALCQGGSIRLNPSGGEVYIWDEHPTLDCSKCKNPVAAPEEITTYFVTVTDTNLCTARDSITVDIRPDPEFEISPDTVICEGERAVLSGFGDYEYLWEPPELVDCDTCRITQTKMLTDTTLFTLFAIDEYGCTASKTVQVFPVNCDLFVDSVNFPARIYCFPEKKSGFISNDGESAVRIDSMVLAGRDTKNFTFQSTENLPYLLEEKQRLEVEVTFIPDEKQFYQAEIMVYSQLDGVHIMLLTAEKLIGKAKLGIDMTIPEETVPGDTAEVAVYLASTNFDDILPNRVQLEVRYNEEAFYVSEESISLSEELSGYTLEKEMRSKPGESTFWTMTISGDNPIQSNSKLIEFPAILMLKSGNTYRMGISGYFIDRAHCSEVEPGNDSTEISFCADTMRAIIIGNKGFSIETEGNILTCDSKIDFTVPYDTEVSLSIFDIAGKQSVIFSGSTPAGTKSCSLSELSPAPGFYTLVLVSGDFTMSKKIIIRR